MKILQLVGSPTSSFCEKLSCLYAKDSIDALSSCYDFIIAYVNKEGWRFPTSLAKEDIERAEVLSLADAVNKIKTIEPDLALPQMFCLSGMTTYRSFLSLMNVPYIGNRPDLMALTADKAKTKAIVATAGVKIPQGEVLNRNDQPSLPPPVVVKPINADNSIGVSFVQKVDEYPTALELAFSQSDRVLVEEFIPGREVRCGIVEVGGDLVCLPLEEYYLDDRYPIRTVASKIKTNETGELYLTAKEQSKAWIVNPDTDSITKSVWEIAKRCHRVLDCRHYSLFDFRISPRGEPYFLEAGLYCSFSPKSVIVTMARAKGIDLKTLFDQMIAETLKTLPDE